MNTTTLLALAVASSAVVMAGCPMSDPAATSPRPVVHEETTETTAAPAPRTTVVTAPAPATTTVTCPAGNNPVSCSGRVVCCAQGQVCACP